MVADPINDVGDGYFCICAVLHINECRAQRCLARDRISVECESAASAALREFAKPRRNDA